MAKVKCKSCGAITSISGKCNYCGIFYGDEKIFNQERNKIINKISYLPKIEKEKISEIEEDDLEKLEMIGPRVKRLGIIISVLVSMILCVIFFILASLIVDPAEVSGTLYFISGFLPACICLPGSVVIIFILLKTLVFIKHKDINKSLIKLVGGGYDKDKLIQEVKKDILNQKTKLEILLLDYS
jgi:hypothetical protein